MTRRAPIIAITQRVVVDAATGERRDALAHDWSTWLAARLPGAVLAPIPNGDDPGSWLARVAPDAVILSGGGARGERPERDRVEDVVLECGLPVLGVCRGAQVIFAHFGGRVRREAADRAVHVGQMHAVQLAGELRERAGRADAEVNSWHDDLLVDAPGAPVPPVLRVIARAADASIEAIAHTDRPIVGVVWHPERAGACTALDSAVLGWVLEAGRRTSTTAGALTCAP